MPKIPTYNELKKALKQNKIYWLKEIDTNFDSGTCAGIEFDDQNSDLIFNLREHINKGKKRKILTEVRIDEDKFKVYISDENKKDKIIKDACELLDGKHIDIRYKYDFISYEFIQNGKPQSI